MARGEPRERGSRVGRSQDDHGNLDVGKTSDGVVFFFGFCWQSLGVFFFLVLVGFLGGFVGNLQGQILLFFFALQKLPLIGIILFFPRLLFRRLCWRGFSFDS